MAATPSRARAYPWIPSCTRTKAATRRKRFPELSVAEPRTAHQKEVDANIREGEKEIERLFPPLSESRPEIYTDCNAPARFVSVGFRCSGN